MSVAAPLGRPTGHTYAVSRCDSCRYWSDLIARSTGRGKIEAVCLSASSTFSGKYRRGVNHCARFAESFDRSIDDLDLPPNWHALQDDRKTRLSPAARSR